MLTNYTKAQVEQIKHANPEDPLLRARVPMEGPTNRSTGYGNHFVELVIGLLNLGCDVRLQAQSVSPPLPAEVLACLLEPWPFDAPVGIIMANPTALKRIAGHTIGITTWETTAFPHSHRRQLSAVDEFIVPCKDNIALLQKYTDKPVSFIHEGIDTNFWRPHSRDWAASPLKIAMFGALSLRKGLDLGVESFVHLFGEDPTVELHIGTTVPDTPLWHLEHIPNVYVSHFGIQTREEVRDWFNDKHAMLAPYRGEGFFLPGAEFMATGGVLIAPDKMGAAHYLQADKGIVIASGWGPVQAWGPECTGAEAAEKFGQWISYGSTHADEVQTVADSLGRFVNLPASEKRRLGEAAAGQLPFICDPLSAANQTLDRFLAAHLADSEIMA